MNIREFLEDPSKLNADTLPELKALVEQYPFYQVARLLYIANLYKLHSQDFGAELRKASSFVPDRSALFALTEGVHYTLQSSGSNVNIETEGDSTRTISLINRFLQEGGIETDKDYGPEREQPSLIDLTKDYASYLMQQDEHASDTADGNHDEAPKLRGADLIDTFKIYTESMVNIYIKQGRYQQALEILSKISLNNPKKSSNFAAQIYLLEVLLKENK